MPRLIVLNGPPGCGKSTLAQMYVDEHPLALDLDIDRIRDLIGQWSAEPQVGGILARAIAIAAARTHLTSGHDVVVPQFFGRPEFLEQLEQLAKGVGADFNEIVLLDSKENVLRRFGDRSHAALDPAHLDPAHTQAQEMLDRSGGVGELAAMYDRLVWVIAARPSAQVIPTESGQVDRAYRDFVSSLT